LTAVAAQLLVILTAVPIARGAVPLDFITQAVGPEYRLLFGPNVFRRTSDEPINLRAVAVPETDATLLLWDETTPPGILRHFYAVSLDGRSVATVRAATYTLDLQVPFEPPDELSDVPDELVLPADGRVNIVQFWTQPLPAFREQISALGGRIHKYVANFAYIVEMSPEARMAAAELPYVRWIGPYHTAYRLEPVLWAPDETADPEVPVRYNLLLFDRDAYTKAMVADQLRSLRATVFNADVGARLISAGLTRHQLLLVAPWDEIHFIDRWFPPAHDMDNARAISGGDYFHNVLGMTGIGVRAEVMDSGILQTHDDLNPAPLIHGGEPDVTAHGTATYGINFGDGINCQLGVVPDAVGIFADFGLLTNRYNHTGELVDPGLTWQAVYQSNSWGTGTTMDYTTISADMDEILFDHDVLMFQSQSNLGDQHSRPQAWAKNILSVGGVRHYDTLDTGDDCWCGGASIGPASDGRIKPDLAHFYDWVATTSSGSDTDCTDTFNGTSAATPITAGHSGLWFELWHSGVLGNEPGPTVFDSRPHMTLSKAMLICTADQWSFSGNGHDLARTHQGWGRVNVENVYNERDRLFWVDEGDILGLFESRTYSLFVEENTPALKAVMTYADPPGNPAVQTQHRINDLDLGITSPSGVVYWGNNGLMSEMWSESGGGPDDTDTVECVFVESPESGEWTVEVIVSELNEDGHVESPELDADFALVVVGAQLGGANTWVDFSYVGPEDGSFEYPFNTLAEGVAAVSPGGTLWIMAGTSSETATISMPMTIKAYGGIVTIGQ
jgi:hypothetical protein